MTAALAAGPGVTALDAWMVGLKLAGAVLMMVGALLAFWARAAFPGLPRFVPWAGLCFAVVWSTDAVVTAFGSGSWWWDSLVALVHAAFAALLLVVAVRQFRRWSAPDGGR